MHNMILEGLLDHRLPAWVQNAIAGECVFLRHWPNSTRQHTCCEWLAVQSKLPLGKLGLNMHAIHQRHNKRIEQSMAHATYHPSVALSRLLTVP